MRSTQTISDGASASIYECDAGEGLPWHGPHGFIHGHCVIRGRTRVDFEGMPSVEMTSGNMGIDIPADVRHAITAIEDGTIFINVMTLPDVPDEPPPKSGGVMLDDGTIVYGD